MATRLLKSLPHRKNDNVSHEPISAAGLELDLPVLQQLGSTSVVPA